MQQKFNTESVDTVKELPLYQTMYPMAPLYPLTTRKQISESQHKRVSMATAHLYKYAGSKEEFSFKRVNLDEG